MHNYQVGLLTTFLLGIFILVGAFIALLINKKEKIVDFSIGLAFGVIATLLVTDLLPETFESFGLKHIYLFLLFSIAGFFLLKFLDTLVPAHHDHHRMTKKEANNNLAHIGIITTLALILHNIVEGIAVYSAALSDAHLGLLLAIGVGFHNIPLGMVIASSFYQSNVDNKRTFASIALVALSTFIGGLVMYIFKLTVVSEILLGILLSLTIGMLVFIILDELIPRIRNTHNRRISFLGIGIGVVILIISLFIG